MQRLKCVLILAVVALSAPLHAQAWRNCTPGSIGPGGCDSIGPGGGRSIGPGGGRSIGPGGGQSIGPGGGQSIGPNGGKALNRDRSRGLVPDTLRPYQTRSLFAHTRSLMLAPIKLLLESVSQSVWN